MNDKISFIIDDREIKAKKGQTILAAAQEAGIYIPRLCSKEGLSPFGSCRVCTVLVNGRAQASCTQPVAQGIVVENSSEKVFQIRKQIIEMLFIEGNHFCMFCEKSGNCELQALAYRFGILAPSLPFMFPEKDIDASHPDVFIDRNRCVLCGRCVRASRELDGKHVFQFVGRGPERRIAVNASADLKNTELESSDKAVEICPVGAIIRKRVGFKIPVGKRLYDHEPIGSDIEKACT
ncbi:MAG: NADP oxidoreductase [Spirochaetes bacterium]|nr:MAG: NADP oxidoreductase [Spirochaetota bacterium]